MPSMRLAVTVAVLVAAVLGDHAVGALAEDARADRAGRRPGRHRRHRADPRRAGVLRPRDVRLPRGLRRGLHRARAPPRCAAADRAGHGCRRAGRRGDRHVHGALPRDLLRHAQPRVLDGAVLGARQVRRLHRRNRRPALRPAVLCRRPPGARGLRDRPARAGPRPRGHRRLGGAVLLPHGRRPGAGGDQDQRDAAGVPRHFGQARVLARLHAVGRAVRPRRQHLRADAGPGHAGHGVLGALGRDRVHRRPRRFGARDRSVHRRVRVQLREALRGGAADRVATRPRPGPDRHGVRRPDRHLRPGRETAPPEAGRWPGRRA